MRAPGSRQSSFMRPLAITLLTRSIIVSLLALTAAPWLFPCVASALAGPGPNTQPPAMHFAIIGDRTGSATPGIYESILSQMENFGPSFVVSVGDHIEGYTEDPAELGKEWDGIHALLGRLSVPFYPCPGNHDITTDAQLPAWRTATGHEPCYSFDEQGIHFIVLDTSRWETSAAWLAQSGYVDWLRADLKQNDQAKLTVVLFHKPYWYNTLADGKPDGMHEIFRQGGVDYVFNGHFHDYASAVYDGIHYTILSTSGGGIGPEDENTGSFFQWAWCTVRGDALNWQIVRQSGILKPDYVTIADRKLLDRIATEYVTAAPFAFSEAEKGQKTLCTLSIQNVLKLPVTFEPKWDSGTGWSIDPDRSSLTLEPSAAASAPFQVSLVGPFYPLPTVKLDYPYKPGRVYHYEAPLPVRRLQSVGRAPTAPKIDGRLDEALYRSIPNATIFGGPDGSACTIEPTTIWFSRDARNLYVAARCVQADGPALVKAKTRDGTVYRDDCLGFFFAPDPDSMTIYQVYFNAAGTIFDQRIKMVNAQQQQTDPKWNGAYKVMAKQGQGEWTLEASIPYSTLNTRFPQPGQRWRVNFRRKEMARESSADWQIPISYNIDQLGYLSFE
jgi:hypothetical protein